VRSCQKGKKRKERRKEGRRGRGTEGGVCISEKMTQKKIFYGTNVSNDFSIMCYKGKRTPVIHKFNKRSTHFTRFYFIQTFRSWVAVCGLEDVWVWGVELAYITLLFSVSNSKTMSLVIIHGLGHGIGHTKYVITRYHAPLKAFFHALTLKIPVWGKY
jgi:hypothetical protein